MKKAISNHELDQIAAWVARHVDGADLTMLMQDSNARFTRRTLQRRLADLAASGRLIKTGEGRALRRIPEMILPGGL